MKKAASISKLIAGIIASMNGLFALFTNTSNVFPNLPDWIIVVYIAVFIILGIFLVFGSILDFIVDRRKTVRQHKFQGQSEEFFQFFADWYRQPGKLSIICGDLDWIKTEENITVYNELRTKSAKKQLTLLLGSGINSKIASELKGLGATVMPAPNNIISAYTFSCLSVMDDAAGKVIIRDKHKNPAPKFGEVIFDEISNTYITELLNALLTREVYDL